MTRPVVAVLAFLAVLAGLGAERALEARHLRHTPDDRARVASLPRAPLPQRGQRVVVFAPHPDDETLGVGGLIRQARDRGAEVWVVFYTDGDGFTLCATTEFHHPPDPPTMRRLGQMRRGEAVRAIGALGVPADHAFFLGYPDRGLDRLWSDHWTRANPFASAYTDRFRVSTEGSFHGDAPYAGESVLADVETLLRRLRPNYVFYSDPADDHPDHWASHCFTRLALERLRGEPWSRNLTAGTYLVHRGEWPRPRGEHSGLPLPPPRELFTLPEVKWQAVDLAPAVLNAKRNALRTHASQEALTGKLLGAFLRRNELLSHWPAAEAPDAIFPDLTSDRWGRARNPGVDFTTLVVGATEARVSLRVRLRGAVVPWAEYVVRWKPVDGAIAGLGTREYRLSGYRCSPAGTRFRIRGSEMEIEVPLAELGGSTRLMIGAEAWSGPVLLDRTPWRLAKLPPIHARGGAAGRSTSDAFNSREYLP
jgi:LmbE family N-acetylglucosaminyl deacetylase